MIQHIETEISNVNGQIRNWFNANGKIVCLSEQNGDISLLDFSGDFMDLMENSLLLDKLEKHDKT